MIGDNNWNADQKFLSVLIGDFVRLYDVAVELKAYEGIRVDWIYARNAGEYMSWESLLNGNDTDMLTDAHCFKQTFVDNLDLIKMLNNFLFKPKKVALFNTYMAEYMSIRNELKSADNSVMAAKPKPVLRLVELKNL